MGHAAANKPIIIIIIIVINYSVLGQVPFAKYLSTSTSTSRKNVLKYKYKYFSCKCTLSTFGT